MATLTIQNTVAAVWTDYQSASAMMFADILPGTYVVEFVDIHRNPVPEADAYYVRVSVDLENAAYSHNFEHLAPVSDTARTLEMYAHEYAAGKKFTVRSALPLVGWVSFDDARHE